MSRDTVFISHATPHDNDFVRWLGTRLTGHGYKVWADLFGLKGGNPFWSTIEEALRHHASKMIFVVSKASVDPGRTGTLNELSVADALKKQLKDDSFIIPVKIDATAFSEFPVQIHRLNAIDFSAGWGAKLAELLDTLECAGVRCLASAAHRGRLQAIWLPAAAHRSRSLHGALPMGTKLV
jgi:hypothetical protein